VNAEASGPKCRGPQLIPTGCERREDLSLDTQLEILQPLGGK
jgi:hypothetical protein